MSAIFAVQQEEMPHHGRSIPAIRQMLNKLSTATLCSEPHLLSIFLCDLAVELICF